MTGHSNFVGRFFSSRGHTYIDLSLISLSRIISHSGMIAAFVKPLDAVYPHLRGRFAINFTDYRATSAEQRAVWLDRYDKVVHGSHVIIDVGENLLTTICHVREDVNCGLSGHS